MDVNDITIAENSRRAVQRFKDQLSSHYGTKDMGNLHWLLGIGMDRDRKNRTISFFKPPMYKRWWNTLAWKMPTHCQYPSPLVTT